MMLAVGMCLAVDDVKEPSGCPEGPATDRAEAPNRISSVQLVERCAQHEKKGDSGQWVRLACMPKKCCCLAMTAQKFPCYRNGLQGKSMPGRRAVCARNADVHCTKPYQWPKGLGGICIDIFVW